MQPSLESAIALEVRPEYLYMKITGVYNSQQFMGLPKLILDECKQAGRERLLVDASEVDFKNLSTMERYFLGEELANTVSFRVTVAAIVPEPVITKFLETVATNRGVNLHVVSDFDKALSWLMAQ